MLSAVSVIVTPAADLASRRSGDCKDGPHNEEQNSDTPENRDFGDKADDEKNESEDDHFAAPMLGDVSPAICPQPGK
jgi:hypothetical protein